jgi:hypothetical protein
MNNLNRDWGFHFTISSLEVRDYTITVITLLDTIIIRPFVSIHGATATLKAVSEFFKCGSIGWVRLQATLNDMLPKRRNSGRNIRTTSA